MRSDYKKSIWLICLVFAQKAAIFGQKGSIFITRQPVGQTICAGAATANFSVEARSGCSETLEYQWFASSNDGKDWQAAPGGKSGALAVPTTVLQLFGQLKLKVRVSGGDCQAVESVAVDLIGAGAVQAAVSPKNFTAESGGSARFECKIEAAPAGSKNQFQWQRSFYATGVFEDLAGQTGQFLELSKIEPALNGALFRARIVGGGVCDKTFSAPAALFVQNAPLVAVTPREKSVCENGSATFGLQIKNGSGSEAVQWQVSRDGGQNFTDLPGETSAFLKTERLTSDLSGTMFRAVVTLGSGAKVPSSPATLTINGTVAMSQQPADFLACVGDSAIFSVRARASGNNQASYQWQQSLDGGQNWASLSGKTREQLAFFVDDETANGRLFRALVTAGECQEMHSETAKLGVVQTINFEQKAQAQVASGESVEIETRPSASPGNFLNQWQWSIDGRNWVPIRDSEKPRLTLTNVPQTFDGRLYRFKMFSKECGRMQFSDPIFLRVAAGR